MSTAYTRWAGASAAAVADQTVAVAPPPGSSTTGGAAGLPTASTCVLPNGVGTSSCDGAIGQAATAAS